MIYSLVLCKKMEVTKIQGIAMSHLGPYDFCEADNGIVESRLKDGIIS